MDIDEYLKRKKELQKKKEELESSSEPSRSIKSKKKEIEVKRHREIVHKDPEPNRRDYGHHHRDYSSKGDHIQWIFLGLAFFVALLFLGIYFLSNYGDSENKVEENTSQNNLTEVEILKQELENLKQELNETKEQEEQEEQENNTGENVKVLGPEFEIKLIDDVSDANSLGIFDDNGKVNGKYIELWLSQGTVPRYSYRLSIKNTESLTRIQCRVDESIYIDEEGNGENIVENHKLDLHILEIDPGDEKIITDSVDGVGTVRGEYEGRCYFCKEQSCDTIDTEAEEKKRTKFKVIMHSTSYDNNDTNNT
jgi:flagellar motor protein MotB